MHRLLVLLPFLVLGCTDDGAAPAPAADAAGTPAEAAAPAADVGSIDGTYNVTGTNGTGTPYTGTLTVTPHADVYQFSWATGTPYEGVGVTNGDAVAVGFGGDRCGTVLYRVSGTSLDGRWAVYGNDAPGTERATRAADGVAAGGSTPAAPAGAQVAGTYTVEGTNPDGSPYTGQLAIAPADDAYRLTWTTGSGEITGTGLLDGDVLATSYGGDACGVASYRRSGTTLTGRWTGVNAGGIGTETATRQ